MRGGFLVGTSADLYARAAHALLALGAVSAEDDHDEGGVVQYADEQGRLFTLYEQVPIGSVWEVREGPFSAAHDVHGPDMSLASACPFECRWPDLVARLAETIGRAVGVLVWVLDGDGVIWASDAVDPARVRL